MSVHLSHFGRYLTQIAPHFPIGSLRLLENALRRGEVIRRQYHRPLGETGQEVGCLLWNLDPAINSRQARHEYFSGDREALAASERLVFYWDSHTVTPRQLLPIVQRLIRQREQLNSQESETIELVQHQLQTCTIRRHEQTNRCFAAAGSVLSDTN